VPAKAKAKPRTKAGTAATATTEANEPVDAVKPSEDGNVEPPADDVADKEPVGAAAGGKAPAKPKARASRAKTAAGEVSS
jgi:hypothetical protein